MIIEKNIIKESSIVIDITIHLTIKILFSGSMLSALQMKLEINIFELGKKPVNLAFGMGSYFDPVRALYKRACYSL